MAVKRDIHERCLTCGKPNARLTESGDIQVLVHACTVRVPGPASPPRVVSRHSANFIPKVECVALPAIAPVVGDRVRSLDGIEGVGEVIECRDEPGEDWEPTIRVRWPECERWEVRRHLALVSRAESFPSADYSRANDMRNFERAEGALRDIRERVEHCGGAPDELNRQVNGILDRYWKGKRVTGSSPPADSFRAAADIEAETPIAIGTTPTSEPPVIEEIRRAFSQTIFWNNGEPWPGGKRKKPEPPLRTVETPGFEVGGRIVELLFESGEISATVARMYPATPGQQDAEFHTSDADVEFVRKLPAYIPALLAEIDRMRGKLTGRPNHSGTAF